MTASDELSKLADRAKQAEARAAAARGKAKADLERDVENARASAQAQADKLRAQAEAGKGKLSIWWNDLQRSWDEHIERIRADIDSKRAEHNLDRAQRNAAPCGTDIQCWDLVRNRLIWSAKADSSTTSLAFDLAGRVLISGHANSTCLEWPLTQFPGGLETSSGKPRLEDIGHWIDAQPSRRAG